MYCKAENRYFEVGDEVLVFLPMAGKPLMNKYVGPCKVTEKVNDENYRVRFTSGKRKESLSC